MISQTLPNDALNLQYDLVVREYNSEGVELIPGAPEPEIQIMEESLPVFHGSSAFLSA